MLLLSSSELPVPYHDVIPASMGPISLTSLTSLLPSSSLHYTTLPISSKTSPQRPCKQSRLVTTPPSAVFSSLAARSQSVFLSWQAEARNLEMILMLLLNSTVVGCRILLVVNGAWLFTFFSFFLVFFPALFCVCVNIRLGFMSLAGGYCHIMVSQSVSQSA